MEMVLSNLLQRESRLFFFIALCSAMLIAATESSSVQGGDVLGAYAYWIIRILTEALLFFALREVVERYLLPKHSALVTSTVAFFLSLVPFVLTITAFDLVLGHPELGLGNGENAGHGRIAEFGLELVYLSDNHLALCLLLSASRLLKFHRPCETEQISPEVTFLQTLEPKLSGDILWITAQEHYVKIVTTKETRTVLYRFSDLVRDLYTYPGMQIHRSHWIAYEAISDIEKSGQTMKVTLSTGDILPVSRTYRAQLEEQLSPA